MTVNEISLFILAAVILIVGLYIDSHRESSRSASANRQADDYRRNRSFYFCRSDRITRMVRRYAQRRETSLPPQAPSLIASGCKSIQGGFK